MSLLSSSGAISAIDEIEPYDLAEQLTVLEVTLLKKLSPAEFYHRAWLKADAKKNARAITAHVEYSSRIRNWIVTELLSASTLPDAARKLSYAIVLAKVILLVFLLRVDISRSLIP